MVVGARLDSLYSNKVLLPSPTGSVVMDAFENNIQATSFESPVVWTANEIAIVYVSIQASSIAIALNGKAPQTSNTSGAQCPATSIGGSGFQAFGRISEMLVFPTLLIAADAAILQSNMGETHGIAAPQGD